MGQLNHKNDTEIFFKVRPSPVTEGNQQQTDSQEIETNDIEAGTIDEIKDQDNEIVVEGNEETATVESGGNENFEKEVEPMETDMRRPVMFRPVFLPLLPHPLPHLVYPKYSPPPPFHLRFFPTIQPVFPIM